MCNCSVANINATDRFRKIFFHFSTIFFRESTLNKIRSTCFLVPQASYPFLVHLKINCMLFKSTSGCVATAMLASFVIITSCSKNAQEQSFSQQKMESSMNVAERQAPKGTSFYALTADQMIVQYSSGNPLFEMGAVAIAGLQMNEQVLAIDFRPATGQLYGVTNMSRLYVINPKSGKAVAITATPFHLPLMELMLLLILILL